MPMFTALPINLLDQCNLLLKLVLGKTMLNSVEAGEVEILLEFVFLLE